MPMTETSLDDLSAISSASVLVSSIIGINIALLSVEIPFITCRGFKSQCASILCYTD